MLTTNHKKILFLTRFLIVFLVALSLFEARPAQAVIDVNVVQATAAPIVRNTQYNKRTQELTELIQKDISALREKELVHDKAAWEASKAQIQQQASEFLKMMGGQLADQDGKPLFITEPSEHYQILFDRVAVEESFGSTYVDSCSEENTFQVRKAVYEYYMREYKVNSANASNQCEDPNQPPDDTPVLLKMLRNFDAGEDSIGKILTAQNKLDLSLKYAASNERDSTYGGFLPKKACREVPNTGSAGVGLVTKAECRIVTPAKLVADSASYIIGQLPYELLLNGDEINEVVSTYMTSLTNQATGNVTGVLGLSGNPEYSSNVYGPNNNTSYADALARDNINEYLTPAKNPIKEALENELRYQTLQNIILSSVTSLESTNASNTRRYPNCYDVTISTPLQTAKNNAIINLQTSSSTLAILVLLNQQYDAAQEPAVRTAIMNTFLGYRNQDYFRTKAQNDDLQSLYIEYDFALLIETFMKAMASKVTQCKLAEASGASGQAAAPVDTGP